MHDNCVRIFLSSIFKYLRWPLSFGSLKKKNNNMDGGGSKFLTHSDSNK